MFGVRLVCCVTWVCVRGVITAPDRRAASAAAVRRDRADRRAAADRRAREALGRREALEHWPAPVRRGASELAALRDRQVSRVWVE